MRTPQTDPIVAEVRAIRNTYAARFNYDVDAMFRDIRARQEASKRTSEVRGPDADAPGATERGPGSGTVRRTATDPLAMYAGCMEEVKKRTSAIEGFLRRELHAQYVQTTAESIALQLRKILELIAMASMVANHSEYQQHRRNFRRDWNAKRILETLEVANPRFYPVPTTQVLDPKTGAVMETKEVKRGFLTKDDYVKLYDACSRLLHAENPFSRGSQDAARLFLEDAAAWMTKIRVLLNHHQVQLYEEDKQIWVLMEAGPDGPVQVYEFQQVTTKPE